jgi:hypothetical protein
LRRYYGVSPFFINDRQICEDVEQVGLSAGNLFAGFSFGGPGNDDPDDTDDTDEVMLTPPETRKYARKRRAARTSAS